MLSYVAPTPRSTRRGAGTPHLVKPYVRLALGVRPEDVRVGARRRAAVVLLVPVAVAALDVRDEVPGGERVAFVRLF